MRYYSMHFYTVKIFVSWHNLIVLKIKKICVCVCMCVYKINSVLYKIIFYLNFKFEFYYNLLYLFVIFLSYIILTVQYVPIIRIGKSIIRSVWLSQYNWINQFVVFFWFFFSLCLVEINTRNIVTFFYNICRKINSVETRRLNDDNYKKKVFTLIQIYTWQNWHN